MKREKTAIQLSDHFTYSRLLRFCMPSVMMMVFTSIYGVVDGFFVSNYAGKTAFAAINLVMPAINIFGGMGFMIGTGGSALVGKTLGEGDKPRANRYFTMMVWFSIILGVTLSLIGIVFLKPIAYALGATDDMIGDCLIYGRIVLGFNVAFMLQNLFQTFLITAEKPKLGLIATVAAGCSNIILDALFVMVFNWGVTGAAVATGLSQVVGGIFPLIYFIRPNDSLLKLVRTNLDFRAIFRACGNGASELMNNISSSVVGMVYNLQLMKYAGENGVAAYGVLMYISFIFVAVDIGYTIGAAPIVSFHYGAKNNNELKNVRKKSMFLMSVSGVVMLALGLICAVPFSKLYVGYDEELYEMTVHAFMIFSTSFLFAGFNIYTSSFFTALNNGLISAIISFLRTLVFQLIAVIALPLIFGLDGIWWAITVADLFAFIISVFFLVTQRKKYRY